MRSGLGAASGHGRRFLCFVFQHFAFYERAFASSIMSWVYFIKVVSCCIKGVCRSKNTNYPFSGGIQLYPSLLLSENPSNPEFSPLEVGVWTLLTEHCSVNSEAGTYHTLKEKPAATAIFAAAKWWLRGTMNRAISSRNEVKFLPLVMILYRWFYDTFKHRTTNSPTPYREKKNIVPLFTQLQHSMQYIRQMSITLQNYQLILQNCHKLAKIFDEVSSNL